MIQCLFLRTVSMQLGHVDITNGFLLYFALRFTLVGVKEVSFILSFLLLKSAKTPFSHFQGSHQFPFILP